MPRHSTQIPASYRLIPWQRSYFGPGGDGEGDAQSVAGVVAEALASGEDASDLAAFPHPQSRALRGCQAVALLGLLLAAGYVVRTTSGGPAVGVALYGMLSVPYLLAKLLLSLRYRTVQDPGPTGITLSVVVPFFNEDLATFERCLEAILGQSVPAEQVFLVDDGSADLACYDAALRLAAGHGNVTVHRFAANQGKRAAQCWAISHSTTALIATIDSDTVLHLHALAEAVKPFRDPRVNGVCGYARGLNSNQNLLTRLIDLRYTNAFLFERSAYSVLGSVLCSTGVLSLWRREVIVANYHDYLGQTFWGRPAQFGDDRRLTAYALRTGRVVLQDSAMALTALPERLPQFIRQQIRWNKSFIRESLLLLKEFQLRRVYWWLGLTEFLYWMILTTMLLHAVLIQPVLHTRAPSWHYLAFVVIMSYARSTRMIGDRRLLPTAFLLAPLYGLMNLLLLVPLRLYSIARLHDETWGTRHNPSTPLGAPRHRT